jgi:hypothetical protein
MTFGEQLTSRVGPEEYRRLIAGVDYYSQFGFRYIDVPWLVQQKVCNSTKPRSSRPIHHHVDALNHTFHIVASAEQSFLQMQYERAKFNQEPMTGRWMTITPCYRDETVLDEQHRIGFVKLELIDWNYTNEENLQNILEISYDFFSQYLPVQTIFNDQTTESGRDIQSVSGHIELGSYGIREAEIRNMHARWIYATGCAEPRLSYAIQKAKSL